MQTPDELRRRLIEIDDEKRGLASDAFALKHKLNIEADGLRLELASQLGSEIDAANTGWAERAGRKGSHSVNEEQLIAQARIVSPSEGGSI